MKTYYSLESLIADIDTLKNTSVYITKSVEFEANKLEQYLFRKLRKQLKDNNIKLVVLKEEQLF